jgi:hypothetical protein
MENIASDFGEIICMDEGTDLFRIVFISGLLYLDDDHLGSITRICGLVSLLVRYYIYLRVCLESIQESLVQLISKF